MFNTIRWVTAAILAACVSPAAAQLDFSGAQVTDGFKPGSLPGNPLANMPAGQTLLSPFGERPVFSPDGTNVAFIGESWGDAFEYDLVTNRFRNLTSHLPHRGFLRVHYLKDGSFLLLGPRTMAATHDETRRTKIELFWMDAKASGPIIPLGVTVFEGIATSRFSNKVAWTEVTPKGAAITNRPATVLKTAMVVTEKGRPSLVDVQEVVVLDQCMAEAQDFLLRDKGVTMPCYHLMPGQPGSRTDVLSVDFATKTITRYPTPSQYYNEIEGIFPDGRRSLIECSGDRAVGMDLCVLDLVTAAPRYTRITRIMDFGRWRYGNPVVSPNGRHIAAQVGPGDVSEIGQGLGIVLIDVPAKF